MNRIKESKLGFTVVELMVTMLAFSVLSLAVGSMLVYGWQGWVRNNNLVAMQRDASLAMMMISKEIRNATYDGITEGSGISFDGSGVSFSESGNNIVRDSDGMVVVNGRLDPGTFVTYKLQEVNAAGKTKKWVAVGFTLRKTETETETESYSIKVSPRNGP